MRSNFQRALRVSILTGVVSPGDAVSETVLADLDAWTQASQEVGRNIDARVYCLGGTSTDARVFCHNDVLGVLREEHFRLSDVFYHHFAIYSPIHDLLSYERRSSVSAVMFHNITPPQYLTSGSNSLSHQSFSQTEAFDNASVVFSTSRFTEAELRRCGYTGEADVLPIFGANIRQQDDRIPLPITESCVSLLYCGRFVWSKGLQLLLDAVRDVQFAGIELFLVGKSEFSDPECLAQIKRTIELLPSNVRCTMILDASAARLEALYKTANLIVLPSYHEGFGMPLVEAMAAGLPVLSSDAGALPEIADGLALTFSKGSSEHLSTRLVEWIDARRSQLILTDRGAMTDLEWSERVFELSSQYTREQYIIRASAAFKRLIESRRVGADRRAPRYNDFIGPAPKTEAEVFSLSLDHSILGSVIARRAAAGFERGFDQGFHVIHDWVFERGPGPDDLRYWRSEIEGRGWAATLRLILNSNEVQADQMRIRVGKALVASLIDIDPFQREQSEEVSFAPLAEQALRLLPVRGMSSAVFVKEAYRAAFGRDADEAGYVHYMNGLQSGELSQSDVVEALLQSDEFLWLQGRPY